MSFVEERSDGVVPLQRPPVEGEEKALEVAQRGIGHVGPHAVDQRVGLAGRVLAERGQASLRPPLHLADDRQQQAVLGSEVVQEHAVARPDGLGDAAQALVGHPLIREVRHHRVEEALAGRAGSRSVVTAIWCVRLTRAQHLVCPCTKWYITRKRFERSQTDMVRASDRRDSDHESRCGIGVRTPGRRFHLARVVAHRLLRAHRARGGVARGPGAVRLFTTGRHRSRERVVICEPGRVFAYELERGLPLRDYRAVVTLTPTAGGTTVSWRSTFRAKLPGTGGIYRRELGKFIRQTVQGLAVATDRVSSSLVQALPGVGGPLGGALLCSFEADEGQPELGERFEQGGFSLAEATPEPVEQCAEAVDGQSGLKELGRVLGEVDGRQLEEPVAVVGHHDLGRCVGQLRPHGIDLGLSGGLFLGERGLR